MNVCLNRCAGGILGLAAAVWPLQYCAGEATNSWHDSGRLTTGFRYSEDAQEYYADLLKPFWRTGDTVLSLDVRGTALEDAEQELNAGLVLRRLVRDPGLILGANLFYDTRWTEHDNTFNQAGAGVEVLSRRFDARANYYHPLQDEEVLSETSDSETSTRVESGRRITTTTTSIYRTYEEALRGFDVEAGCWLPFLERMAPTALFVGYYNFSSDHADDLAGVRVRLESRVHPNLTLDAEWFEDRELNETEYFVGARVQVPLDFWNGIRFRAPEKQDAGGHPLEARMSEMVGRDFRIRTITTGPIVADTKVEETSRSLPRDAPEDKQDSAPDEPAPSGPAPNCVLDANGEIVCS